MWFGTASNTTKRKLGFAPEIALDSTKTAFGGGHGFLEKEDREEVHFHDPNDAGDDDAVENVPEEARLDEHDDIPLRQLFPEAWAAAARQSEASTPKRRKT